MRLALRALLGAIIVLLAHAAPSAAQKKPRIPPGTDPGGTAIALITTGIDYTDPAIAACLARDGEGEVIGWDLVDNDRKPWRDSAVAAATVPANWGRDTEALARSIPCKGRVRIVPVRIDPEKPLTLGQALEFAAGTPARIVVIPMWSPKAEDWIPFGSAANAFSKLLIITAAGDGTQDIDKTPVYPAAFAVEGARWAALPNLAVAASAEGDARTPVATSNHGAKTVTATVMDGASDQPARPTTTISPSARAAVDLAWSLACSLKPDQKLATGQDLKQRLLALRRPVSAADGRALFDPGCRVK